MNQLQFLGDGGPLTAQNPNNLDNFNHANIGNIGNNGNIGNDGNGAFAAQPDLAALAGQGKVLAVSFLSLSLSVERNEFSLILFPS